MWFPSGEEHLGASIHGQQKKEGCSIHVEVEGGDPPGVDLVECCLSRPSQTVCRKGRLVCIGLPRRLRLCHMGDRCLTPRPMSCVRRRKGHPPPGESSHEALLLRGEKASAAYEQTQAASRASPPPGGQEEGSRRGGVITFMEMSLLERSRARVSAAAASPGLRQPSPPGSAHSRPLFGHSAFVSSGRLLPCPCVLALKCCPCSSSPCTQSWESSEEPGPVGLLYRSTMASDMKNYRPAEVLMLLPRA